MISSEEGAGPTSSAPSLESPRLRQKKLHYLQQRKLSHKRKLNQSENELSVSAHGIVLTHSQSPNLRRAAFGKRKSDSKLKRYDKSKKSKDDLIVTKTDLAALVKEHDSSAGDLAPFKNSPAKKIKVTLERKLEQTNQHSSSKSMD